MQIEKHKIYRAKVAKQLAHSVEHIHGVHVFKNCATRTTRQICCSRVNLFIYFFFPVKSENQQYRETVQRGVNSVRGIGISKTCLRMQWYQNPGEKTSDPGREPFAERIGSMLRDSRSDLRV